MTAPFRILVPGTRYRTDERAEHVRHRLARAAAAALGAGVQVIVRHGKCPNGGVDKIAHDWAEATPGATAEPMPADWDRHGLAAGPIRNSEMVALGAEVCEAFPAPGSRGTWDCIRRAADAGIPVQVWPLQDRMMST